MTEGANVVVIARVRAAIAKLAPVERAAVLRAALAEEIAEVDAMRVAMLVDPRPRSRHSAESIPGRLLALLSDGAELRPVEACRLLGVSQDAVNVNLSRLKKTGEVVNNRGRWKIAEAKL